MDAASSVMYGEHWTERPPLEGDLENFRNNGLSKGFDDIQRLHPGKEDGANPMMILNNQLETLPPFIHNDKSLTASHSFAVGMEGRLRVSPYGNK